MFSILKEIFSFLVWWWWVLVPVALFLILEKLWLYYITEKYFSSLSWVLLEIKMPKEVKKTPKSMEQIFSALHGTYLPPSFFAKYFKGKIVDWFSFEIVGINGSIHFYIRVLSQYRNFIESQIYAQYPDAEIIEVEDYTENFAEGLPNKDYDLWGCEFALSKPDPYPIRTYTYFEAEKEEQRVDPLASLIETLSNLKEGEEIWVQYLVQPTGNDWKDEGKEIVNEFLGRKKSVEKGVFEEIILFFREILDVVIYGKPPGGTEEKKESLGTSFFSLSSGEQEVVKAIERNISKLGFNTMIKFLYIARKDIFSSANISAVIGSFKQFNTLNLNGFRPNVTTMPLARHFFKKKKILLKKRLLFNFYKERRWMSNFFIFNTEELATVYHFPITTVKSPSLVKIEAKKGEPPPTLPVK